MSPPREREGRPRAARGPLLALLGIAAICQRAYLTLWRQPVLILSTMLFPIVYLVVLGNALNRQLQDLRLAVVDEAGNSLSRECRRGVLALQTGRRLVLASFPPDRVSALEELRKGRVRGVWVLPFGLTPGGPAPAFIGDNTDRFSYETLESALSQVWADATGQASRAVPSVKLEAYPYVDYLTYLGPAVVCLAIFMGSMVSGGLQAIEDRMYGYHEGYLVTPISTGTLVAGHVLSGAIVAAAAGLLVLAAILLIAPWPVSGGAGVAAAAATIFLTSLAISALWFLLFARVEKASVLRGTFGIINVLVFFSSGALYPVESYPTWLRVLSDANPLTYGLRALRDLLLRGTEPATAYSEWVFLGTFTLVCSVLTQVVFKRRI